MTAGIQKSYCVVSLTVPCLFNIYPCVDLLSITRHITVCV